MPIPVRLSHVAIHHDLVPCEKMHGFKYEHEVEDNYMTAVLEVTWCNFADEGKLRYIV